MREFSFEQLYDGDLLLAVAKHGMLHVYTFLKTTKCQIYKFHINGNILLFNDRFAIIRLARAERLTSYLSLNLICHIVTNFLSVNETSTEARLVPGSCTVEDKLVH